MSSYLELCQKFRAEVGIAGTGPASVLNQTGMMSKVVNWVADADVAIQSKWSDWTFLWTPFTSNTISGVKDVSAPIDLDMWDVDSFWLNYSTDPKKLEPMGYYEWRDAYPFNPETGEPTFYIIRPDEDIILYPTPNDVYTLSAEYWKSPTRMSANASTSPIPSQFDRLIIAQAKMYYAEHENAPEVMDGAFREYTELMVRLEAMFLPGMRARTTANPKDMVIRPE
jgi:hypothetical protein